GDFIGHTDLYILPGFEFKAITGLLTNFHQPESTLLCMVSAFQTPEKVLAAYRWAVDRKFRLFSYGDLTVWKHPV
ncbi:MAG: S-adenosylmethionine:tRNA ribosyltransferase-isomerase, partial [Bdellovibrionales bacterium]|nr:S-adenosylmethionine:tRNA ribosyltransferase-isomerase [Bdellovibrionales bacterium]